MSIEDIEEVEELVQKIKKQMRINKAEPSKKGDQRLRELALQQKKLTTALRKNVMPVKKKKIGPIEEVDDEEEVKEVKEKKRKTPKKVITPIDDQNEEEPTALDGTPRRTLDYVEDNDKENVAPETPIKRGRGRPKKIRG